LPFLPGVCHSLKTLGYLQIRGNAAYGCTFHGGLELSERSEWREDEGGIRHRIYETAYLSLVRGRLPD